MSSGHSATLVRARQRVKRGAIVGPGESPEWYMRALARYPLLSADQELQAAREICCAELDFWLAVLGCQPALRLIAALDARASQRNPHELRRATLQELWRACEKEASTTRCGAERVSCIQLTDLAESVRRWDLSRHGMQLALAWVESRTRRVGIQSGAPTETLTAYQQAVRRMYSEQARAKQRFASANLRLVMMIASQHNHGGLPLSDLIQEGNVGLMTAVERFDPSRGLRFSTYATFWIRHMIRRALTDKSRTVRAPEHRQQQARELARAIGRCLARTGRVPTTGELAKELRWPERRVLDFEQRPTVTVWSLERPMNEQQGEGTFLDALADVAATPADEAMAKLHSSRELARLLDELRPVEAHILRCRFGLDGNDETTFQSLGDELQISRERVRQLQQAALQRLRRRIEARADNPEESNGTRG